MLPAEDEEDVHPFLASGTCLKLQYNLSRPMVPRPPTPAPPSPKVADLIPKRVLPQFAAKTAAKEFQGQIASLVEVRPAASIVSRHLSDFFTLCSDARGGVVECFPRTRSIETVN